MRSYDEGEHRCREQLELVVDLADGLHECLRWVLLTLALTLSAAVDADVLLSMVAQQPCEKSSQTT
jgi:hypothetical protein